MRTPKSKSKSLTVRQHRFRSARAGTLASFLLLPMALPVSAANLYWEGIGMFQGGATPPIWETWQTAANWNTAADGSAAVDPAASPTTGDIAIFNTTVNNGTRGARLNANRSIDGLIFNNTGTTGIAAETSTRRTLTIGLSGITVANTAGSPTLGTGSRPLNVTLGASQIWQNDNSAGTLSLLSGSATVFTTLALGTNTLTVDGVGATTFSSDNITGTSAASAVAIIKNGAGVLTFNSAGATFSGDLQINAGTVRYGVAGALPSAADVIFNTASGTATLDLNNLNGTIASLTLGGASGTVAAVTTGTGILTLDGNVIYDATNNPTGATIGGLLDLGAATRTFTVANSAAAANDLTVSAAISSTGGALIKDGAGTMLLSGPNTYTGTTTVSDGTLRVNGSLGDTAVTIAGAATLGGSGTVGTSTVLNTLTVNGALDPGNSTGILTVNDNLDLNGSLSVELNGTSAGTGHDQVAVNGAVDIAGSSLTTSFGTFTPVNGNLLFIVLNDDSDAVTGTFTGLSQDAVVASYGGFLWKISYNANSAGNTFTGGNDIALLAVTDPNAPVIVSSWTFDAGANPNARLASSGTATGLTVSQLTFHPTFDVVPTLVNNDPAPLIALSTHDRWAADSGIGIIRIRRADYLSEPGRSATFNSTNTSISSAAGTLGAPIWFSVSTDALTNATINAIVITNPGGSNATTYYFSKSGDPLGTGVSDAQPTIYLSAPITLAANETVYFSINMDSLAVATNHNIDKIDLKGTTVALPPPIGLVTSTLTVGAPHGTYNLFSATLDPGPLGSSSDTSDLNGTVKLTVEINPDTGKTALLTLSEGRVDGTPMSFVKTVPFLPLLSYSIQATNLSAEVKTVTPPGNVNPDTGLFAANQHSFILDRGSFDGTAATQTVEYDLSPPTKILSGTGTGNGTLTLTPAGTSGPYKLFDAVVILPVGMDQTIVISGVDTRITGSSTVKATGQIQMIASEFNAWMLAQGANSFDPKADTAGNGAPDGIKWALGLSSLYDNPLPFLLKPHPTIPKTFTITLPSGGTVAPLTVESSTNLMPPWTPVPAGQMAPSGNPIPIDSTGTISITPTTANKLFLRMRADP